MLITDHQSNRSTAYWNKSVEVMTSDYTKVISLYTASNSSAVIRGFTNYLIANNILEMMIYTNSNIMITNYVFRIILCLLLANNI